ncbi:hypothetical protein HZB94_03335 [Candidatus Falkowbacteria bacterium]|nr:hypothetical protein [Candidatus Falkowbacteria bacterium]
MGADILEFKRRTTSSPKEIRQERTGQLLLLNKNERETAAPADERHIITAFIEDALLDPKDQVLSQEEGRRLRQAVAPLIAMFPVVDREIIDEVRNEYRPPKPPPGVTVNKEQRYWEAAEKIGFSPIPVFDLKQARACFLSATDKRPKRMLFFKPELRREIEEYPVPYHFRFGEMFFFIILRMFRQNYQYPKIRTRISELKEWWKIELDERTNLKMSFWSFLKSFF